MVGKTPLVDTSHTCNGSEPLKIVPMLKEFLTLRILHQEGRHLPYTCFSIRQPLLEGRYIGQRVIVTKIPSIFMIVP